MNFKHSKSQVASPDSQELSPAELDQFEDIKRQIEVWLGEPEPVRHLLFPINRVQRDLLEDWLLNRGLRLRLNWSSAPPRVEITMPKLLHEAFHDWVQETMQLLSAELVKRQDLLGFNPVLSLGGSANLDLKLPDSQRTEAVQPDMSILVMKRVEKTEGEKKRQEPGSQDHKAGERDTEVEGCGQGEEGDDSDYEEVDDKDQWESKLLQTLPAIVIEVALSQTLRSILEKAWKLLYGSGGDIRAVIIYHMSYPIESEGFKAELAVWVREEGVSTPDAGEEQPSASHPQQDKGDDHCGGSSDSATAVTTTAVDEDVSARVSWDDGVYVLAGMSRNIRRRGGPIVLIDERHPGRQRNLRTGKLRIPKLTLSILDLVSVCQMAGKNSEGLKDCDRSDLLIKVSLLTLRRVTLDRLQEEREKQGLLSEDEQPTPLKRKPADSQSEALSQLAVPKPHMDKRNRVGGEDK